MQHPCWGNFSKTVVAPVLSCVLSLLLLSGLSFHLIDWSVPAGHTQNIDTFVAQAMETLSVRPESIEEIGEANVKHSELLAKKPEVL